MTRPGLVPSLALLLVSGAGTAYTLGLDQWLVRAAPEELRGRAMTLLAAGLMTGQGVGMALAGVLGTMVCALLAVAARRTGAGEVGGASERTGADRKTRQG